ncbi:proliferating cell nuclear antigen [Tilletia horrida]|nr:proliferating cell nuclear antigen [Tilletia horrida]
MEANTGLRFDTSSGYRTRHYDQGSSICPAHSSRSFTPSKLKDLITDANFDCNDDGIVRILFHPRRASLPPNSDTYALADAIPSPRHSQRLQAMDNSHVALTAIELRAEGFQPYRCDRPMSIGVSLANLTKVVKTGINDGTQGRLPPPPMLQLNAQARENAGTKEADPDKQSDAVTVQPAPAPTSSSATAQTAPETQTAPASVPTQESSAPVNQAAPSSEPTGADVEMQEAQPGIMHKYSRSQHLNKLTGEHAELRGSCCYRGRLLLQPGVHKPLVRVPTLPTFKSKVKAGAESVARCSITARS